MLTLTQCLMDRLLALRNHHFCGLDLLLLNFSPWLTLAWLLQLPGSGWLALGLPGLLSLGLWRFVVRAETKSLALQRPTPTIGDSA